MVGKDWHSSKVFVDSYNKMWSLILFKVYYKDYAIKIGIFFSSTTKK